MNIDALAKLVSSADLTAFRTIVNQFLPMIGMNGADYCDGPYDGGKDFRLIQPSGNAKIAIQISVEKEWANKIRRDAEKVKHNFSVDHLIFISSQRIPERSFETTQEDILQEVGVSVSRYDCQTIASRFIRNDSVEVIYAALGIDFKGLSDQNFEKYLDKKTEAVTSLLIFDEHSKDLREGLYEAIIKSALSTANAKVVRKELINTVIAENDINPDLRAFINSRIDRLIQRGEIKSSENFLSLSSEEFSKFSGLVSASRYNFQDFQSSFEGFVKEVLDGVDDKTEKVLIENFLDLVIGLSKSPVYEPGSSLYSNYNRIFDIVSSRVGQEKADSIFIKLSEFVASSEFVKQLACVNLFERVIKTESKDLINALGGTENLEIFIESSVFMPMICNLLFEESKSRASKFAANLYNLIIKNGFKAVIPDVYIEEASAHLIKACVNYKYILENPEVDLAFSGNAFASHYSSIRGRESSLSFSDYVKSFGLRLNKVTEDMDNPVFYRLRDKVSREISKVAAGYGFMVFPTHGPGLARRTEQLRKIHDDEYQNKPDILIEHDAKVICYLSDPSLPNGPARVLCTWEKSHSIVNPDGDEGYYVMSPVSLIDYLSLSKPFESSLPVSQLVDFALLQSELHLQKASTIWDVLAELEKGQFSDAQFLVKAREFVERYMETHGSQEPLNKEDVKTEWLSWKRD